MLMCVLSVFLVLHSGVVAKEGTLYLKNGKTLFGNISHEESGKWYIEMNNCGLSFSKKEVRSVKYTEKDEVDKLSKNFIQKMKNTGKIKKENKEKKENYKYDPLIYVYSEKYNLDPAFVKSVIEAESSFNPNDISCKGAIGLMQIMPQTAIGMKVNPMDIEQNIDGGTRYLNYMLKMFGDPALMLAGYNAGPNAVKKYGKKVPPYKETQSYIENVMRNYYEHKSDKQIWCFIDENDCIHFSDSPKDKRYKRIER